mmetsp:Transcript_7276/g.16491  ORF Transcript_7276/g.16491 Transcript_7276/m.16491 type:complete len:232 (-) Transcript_7276:182-877(-)
MAGTAKNWASVKRFVLCSMPGGVMSSFRARQCLKRATECDGGTRLSFSPWMKSVGHETLPMSEMFGNRSSRTCAINPPTRDLAASRTEAKAATRMRPPTGNLLARYTVGPDPTERPKRMICSYATFRSSRMNRKAVRATSLRAASHTEIPWSSPYPGYSTASTFILNWSRMSFTNGKHMPRSSALPWQKRITPAARGAGSHMHGMPSAYLSSSTRSGETASFQGIQHRCFL